MRKGLLFCLFVVWGAYVFAQEVSIFEKGNKFGLKDDKNKVIIRASFDYIYPLTDNYFLIELAKKIGVANKAGQIMLPPVYQDVQNLGNDEFMVLKNSKWGIVDKFNRPVLPIEYTGIDQLTDYLYIIRLDNRKGLTTKFGTIVAPVSYDEITNLTDNLFLTRNGRNVGLIDDLGRTVIPDKYHSLEKLPQRNMYKVSIENKLGLLDLSGKSIADPVLDEIDCSTSIYYITVKKEGKYGFVINKQYIPATYDKIVFTQDELGVIAVRKGNLNGFITTNGLVIPPIYDNISRFSAAGYAFVEKRGKLMLVDITGKESTMQEVTGSRH
ncbi:WG repeat-containing protein [Viscerimonas tarda]